MNESYDVIIEGGGISGLLAAHRIAKTRPDAKVLLLEKESRPGGRLMTRHEDAYGYGFHSISPKLYEFWNQALKSDPEADDLPAILSTRQTKAAILMGNKLSGVATQDLCSERGARALGGLAASRQWSDVKSILTAEDAYDDTFATKWKSPRKSPAPLVLETYSQAFGITDIWDVSPGAIAERAETYTCQPFAGDWSQAIAALTKKLVDSTQLTLLTGARIIDASRDGDDKDAEWHVHTAQGVFTGKSLVVAQPPWTASQWLPKKLLPTQLLTMINKTKPVSVVTLSAAITDGDVGELPQLVFIPAEGAQAIISPDEIVIQATIDYEMSVVAPDVVKAVKRLKRAMRKLLAAATDIKIGPEHVALVPVGWSQSPVLSERKHLDKLNIPALQDRSLAFCGDAYGKRVNGDDNLIESVISACEAICK